MLLGGDNLVHVGANDCLHGRPGQLQLRQHLLEVHLGLLKHQAVHSIRNLWVQERRQCGAEGRAPAGSPRPCQGPQVHTPGSTVAAAPEAFPSAVGQAPPSALGPAPPSPGCLGSRQETGQGLAPIHLACVSVPFSSHSRPLLWAYATSLWHELPSTPYGVRLICLGANGIPEFRYPTSRPLRVSHAAAAHANVCL